MMSAFSNGFEWECWADNWCHNCIKEATCPILDTVFLDNTVPAVWASGDDDLRDRYHCPEFEKYPIC